MRKICKYGESQSENDFIIKIKELLGNDLKVIYDGKRGNLLGSLEDFEEGYMLFIHKYMNDLTYSVKNFKHIEFCKFLKNLGISFQDINIDEFNNDICIIKKEKGTEKRIYIENISEYTHSEDSKAYKRDCVKKYIFTQVGLKEDESFFFVPDKYNEGYISCLEEKILAM